VPPVGELKGFEDLAFLFHCSNRDRGVVRMNFDEAALLWKAVTWTQGTILEIGRCQGGSTVLLMAAAHGRRVVSVDWAPIHHPVCQAIFDAAAPGLLDLRVADSRAAIPETFGLLFIDGDHTYEGVAADTKTHWPALAMGGLAAYHDAVPGPGRAHMGKDAHFPGVNRLCGEIVEAGLAKEVEWAGSLLVLEKTGEW
jgi:predicted O-methyltransferase YrrM